MSKPKFAATEHQQLTTMERDRKVRDSKNLVHVRSSPTISSEQHLSGNLLQASMSDELLRLPHLQNPGKKRKIWRFLISTCLVDLREYDSCKFRNGWRAHDRICWKESTLFLSN